MDLYVCCCVVLFCFILSPQCSHIQFVIVFPLLLLFIIPLFSLQVITIHLESIKFCGFRLKVINFFCVDFATDLLLPTKKSYFKQATNKQRLQIGEIKLKEIA